MAAYKVVFEFSESNGSTFSEVYYRESSSPGDAVKGLAAVIDARQLLLNRLNNFDRVRAAALDASRATAILPVNRSGWNTVGPLGSDTASFDQVPLPVGAAIVCVLGGSGGGSRRLWVRGCNLGDYRRNSVTGVDQFSASFQKNFAALVVALNAAGFGIRRIGRVNPTINPARKIVSVNGTRGDGTSDVTTDGLVSLDATQRAVITRASPKDLPGLNGRFSVLKVAGMVYTIAYRTPEDRTITATNSGYMHAEVYGALSPFDPLLCKPDHLGTRTSKNPRTRSRGARRAQRTRLLV